MSSTRYLCVDMRTNIDHEITSSNKTSVFSLANTLKNIFLILFLSFMFDCCFFLLFVMEKLGSFRFITERTILRIIIRLIKQHSFFKNRKFLGRFLFIGYFYFDFMTKNSWIKFCV